MLYHLKTVRFHAIPYVEHKGHSKKVAYAHCIYPTISLINHSSNPSVSLVNIVSGGVFACAIRSLRAGDEISIQYEPYFAEKVAEEQRSSLKKGYRFECSCEVCSNKWFESERAELIKCPSCQHFTIKRANQCSRCKDKSGSYIYKLLIEKDMQFLSDCVDTNEWSKENVFKASALAEQFQALLSHPSRILSTVIQKYVDIIESGQGVSTSESLLLVNQLTRYSLISLDACLSVRFLMAFGFIYLKSKLFSLVKNV